MIRASCGYNQEKLSDFSLKPEETFLWRKMDGEIWRTEIIELVPEDNS